MIIDLVKSQGVPYRCGNCNTYFAWKPDEQGVCYLRSMYNQYHQCKEVVCEYYKPARKKCPECGSDDLYKVSTIAYKIMREIRR